MQVMLAAYLASGVSYGLLGLQVPALHCWYSGRGVPHSAGLQEESCV